MVPFLRGAAGDRNRRRLLFTILGLTVLPATRCEPGDIQVNLLDKHERDRKSHEIALAVREQLAPLVRKFGATVKVVEVPPGPPVLAPIVAEIYGLDYQRQIKVAERVRALFAPRFRRKPSRNERPVTSKVTRR